VAREYGQWQPLDEVPDGQHVTIRTDRAITLAVADLAAAAAQARGARPQHTHLPPGRGVLPELLGEPVRAEAGLGAWDAVLGGAVVSHG